MAISLIVGNTYNVIGAKGAFTNAQIMVAISENKQVGLVTPDMDLKYLGKLAGGKSGGKHHTFQLPEGVTVLGSNTIVGHPNHFDVAAGYNANKVGATKGTLAEQIATASRNVAEAQAHLARAQGRMAELEQKRVETEAGIEKAAAENPKAGPCTVFTPEEIAGWEQMEAERKAAASAE